MDNEKMIGSTQLGAEEKHVPAKEIPIYNKVELASEVDLSVGAILKGTAAQPLTTLEKKAALINGELDKFGLGRYQICIWFLCGFGYFLDLAWAQGVGIMMSAVYQEMNVPSKHWGDIFACSNAGLAVGSLFWGFLVDIVGRKWSFNLTCLITSIFGMLLAAPKHNYGAMCAIYFLACIGLGGNIPIDATITLEYLPQNRRFLVPLLSIWQPIGVTVASGVALGTAAKWRCAPKLLSCYAVNNGEACCSVSGNMGWRYEVIVLGCMTLAVFFLRVVVFRFYESPKFLLGMGKEAQAIEVLHKIAKFNRAPAPTLTLADFAAIDESASITSGTPLTGGPVSTTVATKNVWQNFVCSSKHLKRLFTNKLQTFIFVLLAVTYMGDYWSFNLAGAYLPIVLLEHNVNTGEGTIAATYTQYCIIYGPGVIGAVIAMFSVQLPLVGRKWSLVFSAICQGVSMALYTQVRNTAGFVGLNALEYIMQTYFNAVLYASAPELFDTAYRGSAVGMLSCLGRLAGIVAPFAGAQYIDNSNGGILWLGAGGIWLSAFMMVFLPVEMRDRQMF